MECITLINLERTICEFRNCQREIDPYTFCAQTSFFEEVLDTCWMLDYLPERELLKFQKFISEAIMWDAWQPT